MATIADIVAKHHTDRTPEENAALAACKVVVTQLTPAIAQEHIRQWFGPDAALDVSRPFEDKTSGLIKAIVTLRSPDAAAAIVGTTFHNMFPVQAFSRTPKPKTGTCYRCNQEGHWASACSMPASAPKQKTGECYQCHQEGHWASACPNTNTLRDRVASLEDTVKRLQAGYAAAVAAPLSV